MARNSIERARALLKSRAALWLWRALQLTTLVGASAILLWVTNTHYPVEHWLFWRYAGYWVAVSTWAVSCVAAGLRLLELLRTPRMPLLETSVYAFASGVLLFFYVVVALGLAGLIGSWLFFAVPLALLAAGAGPAMRWLKRARNARARLLLRPSPPWSAFEVAALVYGVLALAYIYFGIMHPENASYDSRWYHVPIAEHHVAEGAIRPYPEGWHLGAFPFLPSVLFTWAFACPRVLLFDHVELCAHIEFTFLLATLLGMVTLYRRLLPRGRGRVAWVSLFLFPGIFVYDSSLILGSDHIAAFFAAPIFLLFLRVLRDPGWRVWSVFCVVCSTALVTKYSVTCLLAFPALAVGVHALRGSYLAARGRSSWTATWSGPLLLLLGGLLLTTPHWLKNWVWYGNPVYPYSWELFANRPWEPYNADAFIRWWTTHPWATRGPLLGRIKATLPVLFTFSFVPHDYYAFHGAVPVFGSLFTLTSVTQLVLRSTLRIWALTIACYLGIFVWFSGMQFDRYLQIMLPWMAVVTALVLALIWRTGNWLVRSGATVLVALQVIWGLDAIAIPGHAMTGQSPIQKTLGLIGAGYRKDYTQRLKVFEPYASIGAAMLPGDRILLHEHHLRLGLKVPVVSDAMPIQCGLDYGRLGGPTQVYRRVRELAITQVAWVPSYNLNAVSYAQELIFYHFLRRHTGQAKSYGGFKVAKLVDGPELTPTPSRVAFFGCQGGYRWGLYSLKSMHFSDQQISDPAAYPRPEQLEGPGFDADAIVDAADYLIHNPSCRPNLPSAVKDRFEILGSRGADQLSVRKSLLR